MKPKAPLDSTLASIRAALFAEQQRRAAMKALPAPPTPFVTISRQAGAGGRTFARRLAEYLNAADPAERPWTVWDRELVEKVAAEQHIPASLVESLEDARRPWMEQFLAGLSFKEDPSTLDEFQVYRRVAQTIRGLAQAGRAIIVGRGGVYATADLAGGVHVRLVAPVEARVARMSEQLNVTSAQAAAEVRRLDHDRDAFHHRYWRGKAILPEVFTITLNTAAMTESQMVRCVIPLLPVAGEAAAAVGLPSSTAATAAAPAPQAGVTVPG